MGRKISSEKIRKVRNICLVMIVVANTFLAFLSSQKDGDTQRMNSRYLELMRLTELVLNNKVDILALSAVVTPLEEKKQLEADYDDAIKKLEENIGSYDGKRANYEEMVGIYESADSVRNRAIHFLFWMIPVLSVATIFLDRSAHDSKIKKILKFSSNLVPLVLSGEKTSTWRLFDDKNLQVGDDVVFVNKATGEVFAEAVISSIREKRFGDIIADDEIADGHESFANDEHRLRSYRNYYGDRVNADSLVKMVKFKLK